MNDGSGAAPTWSGHHHVTLNVQDVEGPARWAQDSEIKPGAAPGSLLVVFRDPDGTPLEMFAPAPT